MYAIAHRQVGTWLSIGGLVRRPSLPCADSGYALHRVHTGHGYARDAMQAVMTVARGPLSLEQVCAIVAQTTARSISLLHHLGLLPSGGIVMPNTPHTLLLSSARLQR